MRNVLLQMAFYIRPTSTQISRGFKVHNLITCESKVQGVVSLGRHWVLFAPGRHWVLTNGTWHVLLQSGNVFELEGITMSNDSLQQLKSNNVIPPNSNTFSDWRRTRRVLRGSKLTNSLGGQNSLTPYKNNNMNFGLARDQVVLLETAANL